VSFEIRPVRDRDEFARVVEIEDGAEAYAGNR
jgi:hypothetical protein